MARILVVEDSRDLAALVRVNLEVEGYEVDVAASGAEALARVRAAPPDLLVLDVMLPGLDGFGVLRAVRESGSAVPVLMLTARTAEADKVRGLLLGADDYLTKPFGLRELLARVHALLRRAGKGAAPGAMPAGAPSDVLRFGAVEVNVAARVARRDGDEVPLSPKAFDLLVALLRRRGRVVTRLDLMREVWGYGDDVVTRTLDTHVRELRRALEADPGDPAHIRTVWRVGYRLDG